MAKLYTSLTQLKMALNGGTMPPMTPLTDEAKKYIDPDFAHGMGALQEHPAKGLRCPIRGCGKYAHYMRAHLNKHHTIIGGADSICAALSIQPTAKLVSATVIAKLKQQPPAPHLATFRPKRGIPRPNVTKMSGQARRSAASTIGHRNHFNTCPEQIKSKIREKAVQIGRTPTYSDVGPQVAQAAAKYFGSWNAALLAVEMTLNQRDWEQDDIIAVMEEWVRVHGRLPTSSETRDPERMPYIPHRDTIVKVFGVSSYEGAMAHLGWILGLDQEKTA